jgi:hypothetical protein
VRGPQAAPVHKIQSELSRGGLNEPAQDVVVSHGLPIFDGLENEIRRVTEKLTREKYYADPRFAKKKPVKTGSHVMSKTKTPDNDGRFFKCSCHQAPEPLPKPPSGPSRLGVSPRTDRLHFGRKQGRVESS